MKYEHDIRTASMARSRFMDEVNDAQLPREQYDLLSAIVAHAPNSAHMEELQSLALAIGGGMGVDLRDYVHYIGGRADLGDGWKPENGLILSREVAHGFLLRTDVPREWKIALLTSEVCTTEPLQWVDHEFPPLRELCRSDDEKMRLSAACQNCCEGSPYSRVSSEEAVAIISKIQIRLTEGVMDYLVENCPFAVRPLLKEYGASALNNIDPEWLVMRVFSNVSYIYFIPPSIVIKAIEDCWPGQMQRMHEKFNWNPLWNLLPAWIGYYPQWAQGDRFWECLPRKKSFEGEVSYLTSLGFSADDRCDYGFTWREIADIIAKSLGYKEQRT